MDRGSNLRSASKWEYLITVNSSTVLERSVFCVFKVVLCFKNLSFYLLYNINGPNMPRRPPRWTLNLTTRRKWHVRVDLQPCPYCKLVPKESALCLLCGELLCFKTICDPGRDNISDDLVHILSPGIVHFVREMRACSRHARRCGAGTCVFLQVNTSSVVVVRGSRTCYWGQLLLLFIKISVNRRISALEDFVLLFYYVVGWYFPGVISSVAERCKRCLLTPVI